VFPEKGKFNGEEGLKKIEEIVGQLVSLPSKRKGQQN